MKIEEMRAELLLETKDKKLSEREYIKYESIRSNLYKIDEDVLITPFYINEEREVYELLYLELNITFSESENSGVEKFSENAILSKEFKDNFNPKVTINKKDDKYLKEYLEEYFKKLKEFNLKKEFNLEFEGELYFQIY